MKEITVDPDQPSSVSITFDHIRVTKGSKALPLPDNVEVIILLQAGLMALFGKQSYEVLLDPLAEVKAFAEEEATSVYYFLPWQSSLMLTLGEALKKTSIPLPTTVDQVREETKKLFQYVTLP